MEEYFKALNVYYDKIYVVSIKPAQDRRDLFDARFAGLDYSYYFGADKNEIIVSELNEKNIYSEELSVKNHRYNKNMRPGEIACSWSHKMIYEEMLHHKYERILIFEDDAVPDPEMMPKVQGILDEVPSDCELLMWGWSKNGEADFLSLLKKTTYHLQHRFGLLKWNSTMIENLFAEPYSSNLKKAGFHDFTYAYSVTKGAAEKLIEMQTPIQYIADNLLAHAITKNILSGYIVYPAAFWHDSLPDGTARDSYIR